MTLFRIVIPTAFPGILSVATLIFISVWNEYLFALILISTNSKRTLPLGLSVLVGEDSVETWGVLMAASVLISIPVLLFYLLAQRQLVTGLGEGAVKG